MKKHGMIAFLWCLLLGGFIPHVFAQDGMLTVSGKVIQADSKDPIVGAQLRVVGKRIGGITNDQGQFNIQEVDPQDTLEIKYYGYLPQMIPINGRTSLTIEMEEKVMNMDEVIVVGYGTQKKSDLTGAVSSVRMDDIDELPVSDIGQALQGRVAGVSITQSTGAPGAGLDITIRGAGTINNSAPLFVVDGVVVNDIDYLAVTDIASTEVLKDAAAVAVYGARAANGVIVITTKQGQAGKTSISLSSQFSTSDYWRSLQVMSTEEYFLLQNLANLNTRNALVQWKRFQTGVSTAADNNWLDIISRQGQIQNHSFSISGGSQDSRYRLSGTLFDNLGVVRGTDYNRNTILADISTTPLEKIRLRGNFIYSSDERNRLTEGDNSIILRTLRDAPTTSISNLEGNLNGTPFRQVSTGTNRRTSDIYQIKGFLDYLINDNLTFTSQASLEKAFFEDEIFAVSSTTDPTLFTFGNASQYRSGQSRIRSENSARTKWVWQNRLNYSYEWDKHSLSGVGVLELEQLTLEEAITEGYSILGNDSLRQDLSAVSTRYVTAGSFTEWSNVGVVGRIAYNYAGRYLAQVNFRADGSSRFIGEKWGYFPSVSGGWVVSRENWLKKSQTFSFLKLRASWGQSGNNRIGNFTFATQVNNGFRAVFGDDNVVDGAVPNTVANSLISWEKTTSTNIGIDMVLWNKFEFNIDAFEKYTSDMLIRVPVVPSAGLDNAPLRNAGDVRNRGIEFVGNYRLRTKLAGKEFKLDFGGNFTYIQNEVVSLGDQNLPVFGNDIRLRGTGVSEDDFGIVTRAEVGRPIGGFYGWVTDGIFETEEAIANSAQRDIAFPGDFRFKDLNGDGVIDEADRTYLGSPMPDFTYGIISRVSYRNFDLSMAWQGVSGQQVFNMSRFYLFSFNGSNALSGTLGDFWHTGYFDDIEPFTIGDIEITESDLAQLEAQYPANMDAELPRLTTRTGDLNQNYRPSDFFLENASYLRLKNIQLSYNLKGGILDRAQISNVKIYLMSQNLLTITRYSGLDPEIGKRTDTSADTNLNFGLDLANYPQTRNITLGINLTI
ncbi:MAG: TonB-dependent receptor [Bacteroidota bacterium]